MNEANQPSPPTRPVAKRGLLCPKCEKVNAADAETCIECGADLYTNCPQCDQRTPAATPRCTQCGRMMYRRDRRHRRFITLKMFLHEQSINMPGILALIGIIVILVFYLFIM